MELQQVIKKLRTLNEPVPKPARLPSSEEIAAVEQQLGIIFHRDLHDYFLTASDVTYGCLEPVTIPPDSGHTYILKVIKDACSIGLPEELLPICDDNSDYFCMTTDGRIVFWSHDTGGLTGETWKDLATWIDKVWIGESQESDEDKEGDRCMQQPQTPETTPPPSSVVGTYVSEEDSQCYIELQADGTFFVTAPSGQEHGEYKVAGTMIFLKMSNGQAPRGTIEGNVLRDPDGDRWIKQ